MSAKSRWVLFLFVIGAILIAMSPSGAQQPDSSSVVPVSTVVTVLGPKFTPPPAVSKDDISVREGEVRKDVLDWVPAQGDKAALELAILIDDAAGKNVGKQLEMHRCIRRSGARERLDARPRVVSDPSERMS